MKPREVSVSDRLRVVVERLAAIAELQAETARKQAVAVAKLNDAAERRAARDNPPVS